MSDLAPKTLGFLSAVAMVLAVTLMAEADTPNEPASNNASIMRAGFEMCAGTMAHAAVMTDRKLNQAERQMFNIKGRKFFHAAVAIRLFKGEKGTQAVLNVRDEVSRYAVAVAATHHSEGFKKLLGMVQTCGGMQNDRDNWTNWLKEYHDVL